MPVTNETRDGRPDDIKHVRYNVPSNRHHPPSLPKTARPTENCPRKSKKQKPKQLKRFLQRA